MHNLIRKITNKNIKIDVVSNSSQKDSLLKWGTTYYSRALENETGSRNTFILHFKIALLELIRMIF